MVRRKLNYGPAEWDALPWHHQKMFLEGIQREADPDGEHGSPGPETDGIANDDALDKALLGAKRRQARRRE